MTLGLLIALAVLAAACCAGRWRRLGRSLYALCAVLFLAVGCGYIPAWLLGNLQAAYDVKPVNAWAQRNAIVVLGGGTEKIAASGCVEPGIRSYARIVEAATLQRDCRKTGAECKIIVSGGDAQRTGVSEAQVYRNALLTLGMAGSDVLIEPYSWTTWQHARLTSDVLHDFAPDHVVLVSSSVHLRRSQLYFSHFGIDAQQVRADYLHAQKSPLPKSHNFAVADVALHEYLEIARYRARVAVGEIPRGGRDAAGYAYRNGRGFSG
ncbi:YdcF family protein [Pantoea sp. 18069]|uniref:YdcF family protein n=1 Tax=Pantoea sp. 18069 TaxID=2681415 RepID=UPI001356BA49|nr:YdcF family protein [Pantoea sp. 18069]